MSPERPRRDALEPQVKGLAFRSVSRAIRTLQGDAVFDAVVGRLEEELGSRLRYGSLIASSWYPISLYRQLFGALLAETGRGPELVRQVGREAMRGDLTVVHKLLLGVLSPETVFSVGPRLFSNYYDTGTLTVLEGRKGYQRGR